LEIPPDTGEPYYFLGEAYFQLDKFEQSKQSYLEIAQRQPDYTPAYYGLVKVCSRLGETDEAARYAKEFQRRKAQDARSNRDLRSQYDDLRQMREKLAVTYTDAGRVYFQQNRPEQAEKHWRQAAESDVENVVCRTLLASYYRRQGQAYAALQQYHELTQLQPDPVPHYQQIGLIHASQGNVASAEAAFKKMVQLAPGQAEGYRMLAQLYLNTDQQLFEASRLATTAVELQPVAASYFVLGWARSKSGDPAGAEAALKTAVKLEPGNAQYRQALEAVQHKP
jgi:tetratricopeptide (TPR) repeat protein